jgi:DNA repair exonuclease SbcCD nuclease subunit
VKLAHLADLHLGYRQGRRFTPDGLNLRENDGARAMKAAVDGVIAAEPEVVLVAGDIYDVPRPSNLVVHFAFQQFKRLRQALPDAPVIIIAGNHECPPEACLGSPLSILTEIGCDVVLGTRRVVYPSLGLSVLAVSEAALRSPDRPRLAPEGPEPHQVLLLHGNVPAPTKRWLAKIGRLTMDVSAEELGRGWSYGALGHWHVQQEAAPRCWYAGSLDYVSTDAWGEIHDEAKLGLEGKGWLLADLSTGSVTRQPIECVRRVYDLPPIDARGMTSQDLDQAIAANLPAEVAGAVIRQVVENVPVEIGRGLNHRAIVSTQAKAVLYRLDLRRPDKEIEVLGVRVSIRGKSVEQVLAEALAKRQLPPGMDREAFMETGAGALRAVTATTESEVAA